MAENNENITITVVERRGKRGVTMATVSVMFMIMPETQADCAHGC